VHETKTATGLVHDAGTFLENPFQFGPGLSLPCGERVTRHLVLVNVHAQQDHAKGPHAVKIVATEPIALYVLVLQEMGIIAKTGFREEVFHRASAMSLGMFRPAIIIERAWLFTDTGIQRPREYTLPRDNGYSRGGHLAFMVDGPAFAGLE
jgi:hypothetical protein